MYAGTFCGKCNSRNCGKPHRQEDVTPCDENGNQTSSLVFYGSSFITNETGEIIKSASRDEETVLTAEFDLDEVFKTDSVGDYSVTDAPIAIK